MKTVADTVSNDGDFVASFAEAWIEKIYTYRKIGKKWVASFAEAWIENLLKSCPYASKLVASFAEAWIENKIGCKRIEK